MIRILLFGKLREDLDRSQLECDAFEGGTVTELRKMLQDSDPSWSDKFRKGAVLVAVNQVMVDEAFVVSPSDEVAFFLPVTGG